MSSSSVSSPVTPKLTAENESRSDHPMEAMKAESNSRVGHPVTENDSRSVLHVVKNDLLSGKSVMENELRYGHSVETEEGVSLCGHPVAEKETRFCPVVKQEDPLPSQPQMEIIVDDMEVCPMDSMEYVSVILKKEVCPVDSVEPFNVVDSVIVNNVVSSKCGRVLVDNLDNVNSISDICPVNMISPAQSNRTHTVKEATQLKAPKMQQILNLTKSKNKKGVAVKNKNKKGTISKFNSKQCITNYLIKKRSKCQQVEESKPSDIEVGKSLDLVVINRDESESEPLPNRSSQSQGGNSDREESWREKDKEIIC